MAVKFSDFTQETQVSTTGVANVTEIVGYESTGELNVRITPLALDTTYAYATTNGASPALTLTGTKPGLTITDQIVTLSGAGSVLLAGTGTNAISITGTTYVLSTTTVALGQTDVPVNFTGSSGGDAHTDTLNLKGSGTVQISSDAGTGLITIDGGAVGDVTSFTNVNGGFVSASIVNTNATGDVSVGTIDLSASGTANTGTFLRGDNQWATPTDLNTTYTLPITGTVAAVTATLTGSDGGDSAVLITAGNDIDFSSITATGFTIDSSASGDTYELNAGAKVGSSVPLNLDANAGADTFVNLTEGINVTLTRNTATEITIDAASTIASVDEKTPGTSTGIPIIVDPTIGAVEVQSMAYAGQGNVGHVPAGGVAGQYLDGDAGAWTTLPSTLSISKQALTGSSSQTDYPILGAAGLTQENLAIYINGVYQNKIDSAGGTNYVVGTGLNPDITFTTAPPTTATNGIEVVITR